MLGFTTISNPPIPIQISPPNQSNFNSLLYIHPHLNLSFPYLPFKSQRNPRKFLVYAEEGINGKKGLKTEPEKGENGGEQNGFKSKNGGDEDEDIGKGNQRPRFNFRWIDLVLDPAPDNIVAVGLAGLLTWASVQVLWQLFFISLAILVAALKYSFIAALLIFILITLL